MKSLVNLFLVLYLVLRPAIPVVDYVVNYDYIKTVLCINKTKPQLMCNGKCYLGKELAKTNNTENTSKSKNQIQKVLDIYLEPNILKVPTQVIYWVQNEFKLKINSYYFLFDNRILKPPIF